MYLIFDTETTGLPKNYNAPVSDHENWPRMVQLAWQLHDERGKLLSAKNYIIKPEGYEIPFNAAKVHGISTAIAQEQGHDLEKVLKIFEEDVKKSKYAVGHNIEFDLNITGAEFHRKLQRSPFHEEDLTTFAFPQLDTKEFGTDFCKIPGGRGGKYKWPTLSELHEKLFGHRFDDAHDAAYDVDATARCFFGLVKETVIPTEEGIEAKEVSYEAPKLDEANFKKQAEQEEETQELSQKAREANLQTLEDAPFAHLHVHTQFSILQATCEIPALVNRAKDLGMPAVTMTDLGNMYGAFHFVRAALKAKIKPIVGCEFFVAKDRTKHKFTKDDPDRRYNQVFLAKHKAGYQNLIKLCSIGFVEGYYAGYPRIDKTVIPDLKDGLIATTGGLNSEIPALILNVGESQAEEAFQWWHEQFGEDFYIQLMRHGLEEEDHVNRVLLKFAKKYKVKYFAANDVFYLDKDGAEAHDILLCVKEGEKKDTPIGRGRGYRFGFPNDEFYFKTSEEMKKLFADLPDAITNVQEILDKIEPYELARDVLLPEFEIPEQFRDPKDKEDGGKRGENAYLRHLTYEGAKERYGEITDEIRERLDFELETIEKIGYPGYFLIVQDFTSEARKMGVWVGPGRGSAAGSAVAYCIGITNVDPIAYDLLFERFLNPERISLPDIDIDFDDDGRDKIIKWVVDKYGYNRVSHIITYGTMAAKSSIRDTARVLDLPLSESDRIAKLVPNIKLGKLFKMEKDRESLKAKLKSDEIQNAEQLFEIARRNDLSGQTLSQARVLEGSVRNTGIHACGIIITPDDLTKFIPVSTAKDADLLVTQFDNSVVEDAGMLKMDFLGLKTLTIMRDAIAMIKINHNVDIDPDAIPLDDSKTLALYQKGLTNGTFQFESPGMQKHLRALKPDKFADLIAMNALYRPGPLEYIPNFIARKHGKEAITYDLKGMEEFLAETYGITVYQEQVMLLSQKLSGFTKGEADALRKGMGKKKKEIIDALKPKFIQGGEERGHSAEKLEKVWRDWEAFAAYAFNKSHSTCYSVVAFQTAYLKAHYPAEYMASVLTHNMGDIKKVTFFMEECQNLGIPVLGPDVNESRAEFFPNDKGQIRFGMSAIKGLGGNVVEAIVKERDENGSFKDALDFLERVENLNRKAMESLVLAGAVDNLDSMHRAQYFHTEQGDRSSNLEKMLRYADQKRKEKNSVQNSMFGGDSGVAAAKPKFPDCERWTQIEALNREKDVVGFYISGHPLDQFKIQIKAHCNAELNDIPLRPNQELSVAGVITEVKHLTSKTGSPFGLVNIEDYNGVAKIAFFRETYLKNREILEVGMFVWVKGRVEERYGASGEWELKPKQIRLLDSLEEKKIRAVELRMSLEQLDAAMSQELEQLIQDNTGEALLRVSMEIPDGPPVRLFASRYRVKATPEFLAQLDQLAVRYEVFA